MRVIDQQKTKLRTVAAYHTGNASLDGAHEEVHIDLMLRPASTFDDYRNRNCSFSLDPLQCQPSLRTVDGRMTYLLM